MSDELGKWVEEEVREIRQEIRESKYGLLKLVGLEIVPVAMGAALGGIGRATGMNWIPAVPAVFAFYGGEIGTVGGFSNLVKYGLGVALPYADKVYYAAQELLNSF
ncbi:MAG: hypothetical protein KC506_01155 [Nanoarchaeota archaeon]|nr:hypothetical protein [Nanoarchaeota archaeon]